MKKVLLTVFAGTALFISSTAMAADIEAGKAGYAKDCAGCHGAKGEGGVGPRLTGRPTDGFINKMKKYHKGETVGPLSSMMTPSTKGLTDADIMNLAAYVETLK